ncbi:MAG: hypothetical protein EBS41_08115 [Actinobacteria bacterium]|nr:hypothetical protein [Actinomycetota bacterium]
MRRVRGRLVRVTIPVPVPAVVVVAPVAPVDDGPDLTDSGLETVDPAIWGPPLWKFLHSAAAASGADATRWTTVLEAMKTGLPCQECTDHYRTWFATHPIADGSVSLWLLALHNDVNRRRSVAAGPRLQVPEWSAEQLAAAYPVAAAVAASAAGLPEGLGPGLVAALRAL